MKLLYACHQFFPEFYTGTERYTLQLVKQMQKMGHYVAVLTYYGTGTGDARPAGRGITQRTYTYEGVPVVALRHLDFDRRGSWAGTSFDVTDSGILEATRNILGEGSFDLVHCVHPMRVGSVMTAASQVGLKLVAHLMDYWILCPRATLLRRDGNLCEGPDGGSNCAKYCYGASMEQRLAERTSDAQRILGNADVVISHSRFLIRVFEENGVDTSRFFHLPIGMDYARRTRQGTPRVQPGRPVTFGFIGTVLPHKGVHVLIEAFKRVEVDDARLRIHGGFFGEREYYEMLLSASAGDPRITFCGEYKYTEVDRILEETDVVVVPSLWYENAPLVISTAQMFGVPVIATQLGGMAEMVRDGENGFTFPIGDADGLAERIHLLATKPEILQELRKRAIAPLRIESEAFHLETLYSEMLRGQAGSIA
jgi:glycosyltransferase involved in cell wall biosynthesis